jgi:dienelactone hydrolase
MRPHRSSAVVATLLLAAGFTLAGCATNSDTASGPSAVPSGIDLEPDTTGAGSVAGALSSATTLPTVDRRLKSATSLAARLEYTSTSASGQFTRVSGAVFVPDGVPPQGGWPVLVYAHPTSGVEVECAPSLSPTLLGASTHITALVKAGYVVTVPDYQGLGVDGFDHPYLEPITAGHNVVDAVRATRRLVPETGDRWVGVGISQGGQAVWAANELAAEYGAGLALLGTVSMAPPTDLTAFAPDAAAGVLTKEQQSALQLLLVSLGREHADLNLDDYRRGVAAQEWDLLSSCASADSVQRTAAIDRMSADDLRPATPEATTRLEELLRQRSLPQRPAGAPMLVAYGGLDAFLPVAWTDRALVAACAMGDVIDIQFQPDRGHSDIDISMASKWIADRFAGVPSANSCEPFLAALQPVAETPAPPEEPMPTEVDDEGAGA